MSGFPSGGAKKSFFISIALALLALVVSWLGFRGSPPQLARDFEECAEQVQAEPPERRHRVQWCARKTTPGPRALATRARLIDFYDMKIAGCG